MFQVACIFWYKGLGSRVPEMRVAAVQAGHSMVPRSVYTSGIRCLK